MHDFRQWWDTVWAQAVHDQQLIGTNAFEANRAKQHAESALGVTRDHRRSYGKCQEARRGAQRRRRGPRGLGEPSGARGEAQGPRRRDFSRHSGARSTHPDRVPHTDQRFFINSVGCFFVCSIV